MSNENKNYDPLLTMAALNMAVVSLHRITSTQDRLILDQEYKNIINNLRMGEINADPELTELYQEIVRVINNGRLRNDIREKIEKSYSEEKRKSIKEIVKGNVLSNFDTNPLKWLGNLAMSCASEYFSSKKEISEQENNSEEELKLKSEELGEYDELQRKLLDSSWKLLRQYELSDNYRLTQNALEKFNSAILENNPSKRFRMLKYIQGEFSMYSPYWFYRAKAAEEANDNSEAERSFAKFNEVWRPVLRKDPYKVEVLKFKISNLMKEELNYENRNEILKCLSEMRENTQLEDWANNIYEGTLYFMLGQKEKAVDCVMCNIDFEFEIDTSKKLLEKFENKTSAKKVPETQTEIQEKIVKNEQKAVKHSIFSFVTGWLKVDPSPKPAYVPQPPITIEPVWKLLTPKVEEPVKVVEQPKPKIEEPKKIIPPQAEQSEKVDLFAEFDTSTANAIIKYVRNENSYNLSLLANSYSKIDKKTAYMLYSMAGIIAGGDSYSQKKLKLSLTGDEENFIEANAQRLIAKIRNHKQLIVVEKEKSQLEPKVQTEPTKPKPKTLEDWKQAAGNGDVEAQYKLAMIYLKGENTRIDYSQARQWLDKAANKGHTEAEVNLGNLYFSGKGVSQDLDEACEWYLRAAQKGSVEAQYRLGELFSYANENYEAINCDRDDEYEDDEVDYGEMEREEKADYWYRKAALNGHIKSQLALGKLYNKGYVSYETDEAYLWYYLASLSGNRIALKAIKDIEDGHIGSSTKSQKQAEAQKIFDEIQRRKN